MNLGMNVIFVSDVIDKVDFVSEILRRKRGP